MGGFPKIRGTLVWGPSNKESSNLVVWDLHWDPPLLGNHRIPVVSSCGPDTLKLPHYPVHLSTGRLPHG